MTTGLNPNHTDPRVTLWKAAADAEYASVIMALANNLTEYNPKISSEKKSELDEKLEHIHRLLKESLDRLESNTKTSYDRLRTAVKYLRDLQSDIEKKQT